MITVTKLRRDEQGFWRARVTSSETGEQLEVDRQHGSWMWRRNGQLGHVHPRVAALLQDKVAPTENAERRAREEARKAASRAEKDTRPDRVSRTPTDTT